MSDPNDDQAGAEQFDEDLTGLDDPVTSDEVEADYPPDHYAGIQFADADVTDESVDERLAQELPDEQPVPPLPR